MAWEATVGENGEGWAMDWDGVARIVRAYCRSEAMLAHSARVEEKNRFGPNLVTVDVDWKEVYEDLEDLASDYLYRWQHSLQRRLQFNYLIDFRARTRSNEAKFHAMQQSASKETFANMERSIGKGETGVTVATGIRDLAAGTMVAISTVATGGVATAALGIGAAGKGLGKFQDAKIRDSRAVGQAILEATGTVVVGMFELPVVKEALESAAMPVAQKLFAKFVVAKIDASLEGVKTLAEGGTLRQAMAGAVAKGALNMGPDLLGMVAKKALPIVVKIIPKGAIKAATKVLETGAAKTVIKGLNTEPGKAVIKGIQDFAGDKAVDRIKEAAGPGEETDGHDHSGAHASGQLRPFKAGAGKAGEVPFVRMADTLHALISGPGTDVDFVSQTAMYQLR